MDQEQEKLIQRLNQKLSDLHNKNVSEHKKLVEYVCSQLGQLQSMLKGDYLSGIIDNIKRANDRMQVAEQLLSILEALLKQLK